MTTRTVEVSNGQPSLGDLLSSVAQGEEIILTRDNAPVAKLIPVPKTGKARIPGLHPGAMVIGPDFMEELPEGFWIGQA